MQEVFCEYEKRGKQGVFCEYEHQACRECSVSSHVPITLNQKGREYAVSVSTTPGRQGVFTISSCSRHTQPGGKGVSCKCEHQEGRECSVFRSCSHHTEPGGKGVPCKCEHQEGRNYSVSARVATTLNREGREYLVSVSIRKTGSVR